MAFRQLPDSGQKESRLSAAGWADSALYYLSLAWKNERTKQQSSELRMLFLKIPFPKVKAKNYFLLKILDREGVCKQMRYMGLLETVRIRRSGYPVRYQYEHFIERYRLLVSGIGEAL